MKEYRITVEARADRVAARMVKARIKKCCYKKVLELLNPVLDFFYHTTLPPACIGGLQMFLVVEYT